MKLWKDCPITRRTDKSYVITRNGLPYHVPDSGKWRDLWAEVDAWAQAHPEQVTEEPAPPVPTEEELLARAKAIKTAELDRAMADIDAELIRSTTDIVAAMLTPATLAADDDTVSAEEREKSKVIFVTLRQVQAQNRALRAQVQTAATVEEVQAVEPVIPDMAALAAEITA